MFPTLKPSITAPPRRDGLTPLNLKRFAVEFADPSCNNQRFSNIWADRDSKRVSFGAGHHQSDPDVPLIAGGTAAVSTSTVRTRDESSLGGYLEYEYDISPGEVKFRLPTTGPSASLTLLLEPSEGCLGGLYESISAITKKAGSPYILQTFEFLHMEDLHIFETLLTGFVPLFDAAPSLLTISRVIPLIRMHKLWEAHSPRIQIVSKRDLNRPNTPPPTQLVVFFGSSFPYASTMAFELRVTDTYKKVEDKGRWGIRFVDAKFPLPRPRSKRERKEPSNGEQGGRDSGVEAPLWSLEEQFVCPTRLEYAGEHDDVTVWFGSEATREELVACLPAEVGVKRGLTLRRKI